MEQKISDAGPGPLRIDPHILNPARNELVAEGALVRVRRHSVDWYALASTPAEVVLQRIEDQFDTYQLILDGRFNARLGSVLEIAVFRALQTAPLMSAGGFRDLPPYPTTSVVKKEEPPSIFGGRELKGNKRFDFLVGSGNHWAGLEVKNIREWLYPDRDEIRALLVKSIELRLPPILVARRIPYVTRRLLSTAGVILWETRHQYYPPEFANLAGLVRSKTSLGYFDVVVSDHPDRFLLDFINRILPEELPTASERFNNYADILSAFGHGEISYRSFAARVRRREAGQNEDTDEEEEEAPFPFD